MWTNSLYLKKSICKLFKAKQDVQKHNFTSDIHRANSSINSQLTSIRIIYSWKHFGNNLKVTINYFFFIYSL